MKNILECPVLSKEWSPPLLCYSSDWVVIVVVWCSAWNKEILYNSRLAVSRSRNGRAQPSTGPPPDTNWHPTNNIVIFQLRKISNKYRTHHARPSFLFSRFGSRNPARLVTGIVWCLWCGVVRCGGKLSGQKHLYQSSPATVVRVVVDILHLIGANSILNLSALNVQWTPASRRSGSRFL